MNRQWKNKTETKPKTNKVTVPGGSVVYVMAMSIRQASRSLPKIFVPGQQQKRRKGQQQNFNARGPPKGVLKADAYVIEIKEVSIQT